MPSSDSRLMPSSIAHLIVLVAIAALLSASTLAQSTPTYAERFQAIKAAMEEEEWAQANKLSMLLFADLSQSRDDPELGIRLAQTRLEIIDQLYKAEYASWDKEAMSSVNEQLSFYAMMSGGQHQAYLLRELESPSASKSLPLANTQSRAHIIITDECWEDYRILVRGEQFVEATQLYTDCTVEAQIKAGLYSFEDIEAGRLPPVDPVSSEDLEALGIPSDPDEMRKRILDFKQQFQALPK